MAFIGSIYLPGFLRLMSLKRNLGDFVRLVKTGRMVEATEYVVGDERERALELVKNYVPVNYERSIQVLRVNRIERSGKEYLVILIVRAEGSDYRFSAKVRMRWVREQRKWRFPLSRVDYANLLSEDWRRIDYLIEQGSD